MTDEATDKATEEVVVPDQTYWTLATLDGEGILTGFERVDSADEWVRSPGKFPVPNGCDLAVSRYRLNQWREGKWRFDPIIHERDEALENIFPQIQIQKHVVDAIVNLAAGKPVAASDINAMLRWQQSFDGAI